jgi:hypothetical protein
MDTNIKHFCHTYQIFRLVNSLKMTAQGLSRTFPDLEGLLLTLN